MSYKNILAERSDKTALITLNRPEKLNAMNYELACELDEELTKIEGDESVRVVVLTGAGPRAFSAGGDIHQMAKSSAEELAARGEFRSQANWHIATFAKPNSSWSLPLVVGMPKAKELLYTGRAVKADEAERIGLLNQVVPSAQLRDTALTMARLVSENDPRMVQGIKRLLHEDVGMDWRGRFDNEQNARKSRLKANHPKEGFKEFLRRKGM